VEEKGNGFVSSPVNEFEYGALLLRMEKISVILSGWNYPGIKKNDCICLLFIE
jgi:hypothetical protein